MLLKQTLALLAAAAASAIAATAHAQRETPQVWMMPRGDEEGRAFRVLFEQPEQWAETRKHVDVLSCTDLNLQRHFKNDEELRGWFAKLKEWKIKMAMEVGAVKEWGVTGEKTFNAERKNWERLQSLGADLHAIAMDEPLCCVREHIHMPDEHALKETANYIALVRQHFPNVLIGDIEPYPSISLEEHKAWIEALQKRLAEMKVRGIDFYRLDVDWLRFNVQQKGSWREVRQLELWCRQRKLPFSLIYWASGYPAMKSRGLADDSTWYTAIMQQGYDYAAVEGRPDQYVIESWIKAPAECLPETAQWTFTRSVLDFARKFVRQPR